MDNKVLIRINSLLDHIDEVINDLKNISFSDFEKSSLLQRATSFSISQIGEMMNRLEEKLGEEYKNIPWKQARNMRNYIVHDYINIEIDDVYKTAKEDLPKLKEEFEKIKDSILANKA